MNSRCFAASSPSPWPKVGLLETRATPRALISPSDEVRRTRILSREEEARLLAACVGKRAHLRAIIICAVDTGMRHGEVVSLRWNDVGMERREIKIHAYNTKTQTTRTVGMTKRLLAELSELRKVAEGNSLVFGIKGRVQKGFRGTADAAGLHDVTFHDLRHTAATRLVRRGIPLGEVGRILGHASPVTTYRYLNPDSSVSERAATLLDGYKD